MEGGRGTRGVSGGGEEVGGAGAGGGGGQEKQLIVGIIHCPKINHLFCVRKP